jgi:hypothetical protein
MPTGPAAAAEKTVARLGRGRPRSRATEEDTEHVDQPHRQVLMLAEEDGGDLTDQPDQAAGGEQ